MNEGRHGEALALVLDMFERIAIGKDMPPVSLFMTMFNWELLIEHYRPAADAMVRVRDEQTRLLLGGDDSFSSPEMFYSKSRFGIIVQMNELLKDSAATYALFVQLRQILPERARKSAHLAVPAMIEAADFALADQYVADPLSFLPELNRTAERFGLYPPAGTAPRLGAELSSFMKDVIHKSMIMRGTGRERDADALIAMALDGLHTDDMRSLARMELATPGSIHREIVRVQHPETPADSN